MKRLASPFENVIGVFEIANRKIFITIGNRNDFDFYAINLKTNKIIKEAEGFFNSDTGRLQLDYKDHAIHVIITFSVTGLWEMTDE